MGITRSNKIAFFLWCMLFLVSCAQQQSIQIERDSDKYNTVDQEHPLEAQSEPLPTTASDTPPRSGLGNLCFDEDGCRNFCLDNRGRCEQYCKNYPGNMICQKLFSPEGFRTEKLSSDKPVLENIGFHLNFYDPSTKRAGDIFFVKGIGDHLSNKIFSEFADEIVGSDGLKILPHPTYFLPLGTKLISPVDGVINTIKYQERDDDYEMGIIPDGFSKWIIGFDHIINLEVQEGDKVNAGDVVGEVSPSNSPAMPPELGWTELQIGEREAPAICPFLLLNKSVKADIEAKITQLAKDWENFIGKDVYQQEKWVSPGCLAETAQD